MARRMTGSTSKARIGCESNGERSRLWMAMAAEGSLGEELK
jgi:hypothetical protein